MSNVYFYVFSMLASISWKLDEGQNSHDTRRLLVGIKLDIYVKRHCKSVLKKINFFQAVNLYSHSNFQRCTIAGSFPKAIYTITMEVPVAPDNIVTLYTFTDGLNMYFRCPGIGTRLVVVQCLTSTVVSLPRLSQWSSLPSHQYQDSWIPHFSQFTFLSS